MTVNRFTLLLLVVALLGIVSSYMQIPLPLRQAAGWVSITILPGAALALLLFGRMTILELCCYAAGLGVPLAGGAALLFCKAGLDLRTATAASTGLFAALLLVRFALPAKRKPKVETRREWHLLFMFAFLVLLAVSLLPMLSYWWRVRSDAWFHGAVTFQILRDGVPPLDPYFAGMKLNYMWFFHFFLAMLRKSAGIDPFWSMFLLNVQFLFCLLLAVFSISTEIGAGWRAALLSAAVVVLGLNGLFWVFWPLKVILAFVGETKGLEELYRIAGGGIIGINEVRQQLSVLGSIPFFLDKYMVGTAFSLSLSLLTMVVYGVLRSLSVGGRTYPVITTLSLTGVLLLHIVVAGGVVVALAGSCAALAIVLGFSRKTVLSLGSAAVVPLAVSGLICASYLLSVTGGVEATAEGTKGLQLNPWAAASVLVSCAGALLLGARPIVLAVRQRASRELFLVFWIVCMVALAVFVKLPLDNQRKFTFMAFIPLACLSGASFYWYLDRYGNTMARRVLLRVLLLLFLLPVNLIAFVGYATSPRECPPGTHEAELHTWIREHTAAGAVFIEETEILDIPVLAERDLFFGKESHATAWGYSPLEIQKRRDLRREIFSKAGLSAEMRQLLATYGRPFYIVVRTSSNRFLRLREGFARDESVEEVFANDAALLYGIHP